MRFLSYGAIGRASVLADCGVLDIIPEPYSRFSSLFTQGNVASDVVLLQAVEDEQRALSFGLACDYVLDAARRARCVIVELNSAAPWTYGTPWPNNLRVDHRVRSDAAPLEIAPSKDDPVATAIDRHVASIIPDGATLQVGVGSLPDATLKALSSQRHLGLHSGVLGDAGAALIERGVIDNTMKSADAGVSVANTLCGSQRSYRLAHRNNAIEIRHSRFTHAAATLAKLSRFHAINGNGTYFAPAVIEGAGK